MNREQARAAREAVVSQYEASGTAEVALMARLARGFVFPFEDAVNGEVSAYHAAGLDEDQVFGTVLQLIATEIGFVVDHLVVRGMTRQKAASGAIHIVSLALQAAEQIRADQHYMPEPIDRPGAAGFDFRSLMKGEG